MVTRERSSRSIEVVSMNRKQADVLVGLLVSVVIVGGGALTWQAYRQQRSLDEMGSMMDVSVGTMHGTNPLWYLLSTIVLSVLVGGVYLVVRSDLPSESSAGGIGSESAVEAGSHTVGESDDEIATSRSIDAVQRQRSRVLDLLPEDERRILKPVLESPGITQIELRDRSDFSKSKVSQTASDLEKRGLLYRERQGRTYRIYPSDDLGQDRE